MTANRRQSTEAAEAVHARLRAEIDLPPFHALLGPVLEWVDAEKGEVRIRLPFRKELQRAPEAGNYHGGAISAFADMVGHAAVSARVGHTVPTINLRVDFLRMAEASDLLGWGRLRQAGRTLAVADVEVTDTSGRLIAVGRGTYGTMQR